MIYSNSNIKLLEKGDIIHFDLKDIVKGYSIDYSHILQIYILRPRNSIFPSILPPIIRLRLDSRSIFWHLKILSNKETFANKFNCFIYGNCIASNTLEDLTTSVKALFLIYENCLSISSKSSN